MTERQAAASAQHPVATVSWERVATAALVVLSIVFSLVPTSFQMTEIGPATTHEIADGSSLRQLQLGSLFLLAALLCARHMGSSVRILLRGLNPFMLPLLLYCGATVAWSANPVVSIKRTVIFFGLVLIGIAISPPIGSARQFTRSTLLAATVLIVISAMVAIALPHIGVDTMLGGAWRGVLWQKNMLGSLASIAVMLWLREALMRELSPQASMIGLLVCLFVLVMTKSATSMLVTCMGIGIYVALRRRWLGGDGPVLRLALAAIVALAVGMQLWYTATGHLPEWQDLIAPIAGLFNKSTDLTGRADIWKLTLVEAMRHPVWGIGYGAFWTGEGGPSQFIADALSWMPAHAHNGYVDVFNELGAVGAALTAGLLLCHAFHLYRLFRLDREDAAMQTALFAVILVSNFSESQLLAEVALQNLLLIYSSVSMSARLWMAREQRRAGTGAA